MDRTTLVSTVASLALLLANAAPALAYDTQLLVASGDPANRLDLVIMGDGYRAEDQDQLTQDANDALSALYLQDVNFRYRNHANVKLVHVISNETGADEGSAGGLRDTRLGAFFNCNGIDRLLCVDDAAVLEVALADAPEFDQILVIVNDTKYGGAGGQFATTSLAPGATDIAVHELGHTLFDLADEYDTATPGFARCDPVADCLEPNVTVFTDLADIKWNRWIEASTPLPTPDVPEFASAVGAFEGARYFVDDQYRPVSNCLMRSLGRDFCSVCSEAGVLATYSYAGPIDALSPSSPVARTTAEPVEFRVQGPRPEPNTLRFTFAVDGVQVAQNATGVYATTGAALGAGTHTVTVAIADDTELVRNDPAGGLQASASWTVTISDGPVAGSFLGFENPTRPWTTVFPASVRSVPDASQGSAALEIDGCFYTPVRSPTFSSGELLPTTRTLAMDVKVHSPLSRPLWSGTIRVRITMPGAFVFNALIDSRTLLLAPLGNYTTLHFSVPTWLRAVMAGNHARSQITLEVETLECIEELVVDNLRFI
jgi:hypothetical protein